MRLRRANSSRSWGSPLGSALSKVVRPSASRAVPWWADLPTSRAQKTSIDVKSLPVTGLSLPGVTTGGPPGTGGRQPHYAALPAGGHASSSDQPVPPGPATAPPGSSRTGATSHTGPGSHEPEPGSTTPHACIIVVVGDMLRSSAARRTTATTCADGTTGRVRCCHPRRRVQFDGVSVVEQADVADLVAVPAVNDPMLHVFDTVAEVTEQSVHHREARSHTALTNWADSSPAAHHSDQ